jgi:hypothetical protein
MTNNSASFEPFDNNTVALHLGDPDAISAADHFSLGHHVYALPLNLGNAGRPQGGQGDSLVVHQLGESPLSCIRLPHVRVQFESIAHVVLPFLSCCPLLRLMGRLVLELRFRLLQSVSHVLAGLGHALGQFLPRIPRRIRNIRQAVLKGLLLLRQFCHAVVPRCARLLAQCLGLRLSIPARASHWPLLHPENEPGEQQQNEQRQNAAPPLSSRKRRPSQIRHLEAGYPYSCR